MYPILIEWGPILVPSWHAFFAIGAIAAFLAFVRLAKFAGTNLSEGEVGQFYLVNYLSGYFGARIVSIIIEQRHQIDGPMSFLIQVFSLGPMTFYGGVIGGVTASVAWIIAKGRDSRPIVDAAMPCLMLGLAFGRVGCFLNGDDFGKPVNLAIEGSAPWWAVVFPNLEDSIPRYPVQLIEAFVALTLFAIGWRLVNKHKLDSGFSGLAILALYAFSRFFLELLRGDPRGWIIENIVSPSQFISVIVLTICILLAWKWQTRRA